MKKRPPIALVVHGHFYQPPRENPWTDEVSRETTAAPFANWNARINAECYRANAYARIQDSHGHIVSIVNNYACMSVDLGPTLARWLARRDAQVMRRIRQGDEAQQTRLGSGGAIAHVWGHPITPLLSPHDQRTQILWGLSDFRQRFGHDAAGMWLPETAAKPETLAALIDAGVKFTILAPEQIEAVRPPEGEWQAVTADALDTGRFYRFSHPDGSGRFLALAIFDGPLSRDLAFGGATRDAASFLAAMRKSAERSKVTGKCLVLAASDGELYGHHKKFADLTLAYATHVAAQTEQIEVTNLGAHLAESPPTWEARLRPGPSGEGTAWSCAHGLGRWQRDCGCRMQEVKGSTQAWRGPLRAALDLVRDRAAPFFEDAAGEFFADPWGVRDSYGDIVDDPPEARVQHLRRLGLPKLRQNRGRASLQALKLLEMQRSLLLMYASCAWFFDDIAGAEPAIAMRRAAHAMDLWKALGGAPPEKALLAILAEAQSNDASKGSGADAYRRACRDRVTPELAVARAAFSRLANTPTASDCLDVPGYDVVLSTPALKPADLLLRGKASAANRRTGERTQLTFKAHQVGGAGFSCRINQRTFGLADLDDEASQALRFGALVRLAKEAREAAGCRALLDVAQSLGPCSPGEETALAGLFTRALALFLEQQRIPSYQTSDWLLALRLAEHSGPAQNTDDWRRLQEIVWEHLESIRQSGKTLPKPLQALAKHLQLTEQDSPS